MNIFRRIACIFLLAGCALAHAGESWSGISYWINKYPSDKLAANGPALLDYAPVKTELRKVLPKSELSSLKKFDVESPAKRVGDYLVATKCLPHNCPSDNAMLVMDLKSKRIWAGFFTREENRVATRWYSNADEYTVLPPEILEQFQSSH